MKYPHPSFIVVKTQFQNIGDALINREAIRLIARHTTTHVNTSICPEHFRRNLALHEIENTVEHSNTSPLKFYLDILRRPAGAFLFLMPGGHSGEKTLPKFAANFAYNIFLKLLAARGVRICNFGVSYERLGPRYKSIMASRSRILEQHYVRDRKSLEYTQNSGFKVDGIIPDMAFALDFNFNKIKARSWQTDAQTICFSFKSADDPQFRRNLTTLLTTVLLSNSARHVNFVAQVEEDVSFMRQIYDELNNVGVCSKSFFDKSNDLVGIFDLYKSSDTVFSNRMHSLLTAFSTGCLPVAILSRAKDQKIRGALNDILMADFIFDIEDVDTVEEIKLSTADIDPKVEHAVINQRTLIADSISKIFAA